MNLSAVNRTVILLSRLFDPTKPTRPFLPPAPPKPVFAPTAGDLVRAVPEDMGLSSRRIAALLHDLREHPGLRMHSVMILRHGAVVCEADFGAQDHRYPRYTFSACKSIVSLAVGILCGMGRLSVDDRIVDLFSDRVNAVSRLRLSALTVEHLLTMRSGIIFNELEAHTEEDWVKAFLSSSLHAEPGTQFQYNSMNTYMLAAIVTRRAGMTLEQFLKTHLFDPMEISEFHWETCPRGIERGGWGLYLRPEDMAKLGLLVLQNGRWNGKQLIPPAYLARAVSPLVRTPESTGRYDYGYQFWTDSDPRAFLANGMFGQNILGFWDTDCLIVATAANDELFQQGPFYDLVTDALGTMESCSPTALDADAEGTEELQKQIRLCKSPDQPRPQLPPQPQKPSFGAFFRRLFLGQPKPSLPASPPTLPPSAARFTDRTFTPMPGEAASAVGLLPVIMQTVESRFTGGFVSVSFAAAKEDSGAECLLVTYREADETHIFRAGLGHACTNALTFGGMPYTACAAVSFPTDEDGRDVCRLTLDFPELPSSRIIKLFSNPDGTVLLRQEETPGAALISRTVIGWKTSLSMQPVIGGALEKLDNDYLAYRIRRTLAPELILQPKHTEI